MNKKTGINIRKLLILSIIALLIWSIGAKYITQHEFIHKSIFLRHNITSITEIDYLTLNGKTIQSEKCIDCSLENTLNDILGYNVALIIYSSICLMLIYFLIKKYEK